MILKPNPSLAVPIYLQLVEQVKHAIEIGALRAGDQLPGLRPLAEELVINVNTVAKAYRELERQGVIELRHGAGAFVANAAPARRGGAEKFRGAEALVGEAVAQLRSRGLSDAQIRRLFEAELAGVVRKAGGVRG
ncbi:MAG TPA: GntR family transcriptional regulator [Gammaproteobacteria bacterium]|nr:GntR family transcriptional regulator [Gammaproteobacteria bacterium]